MLGSQQDATAAALCYLNIKFTTINTVAATVKGTPAYGVLQTGDDITAVDGTPVNCQQQRRHHDPGPQAGRARDSDHRPQGRDQDASRSRPRTSTAQPVVGVELAPPTYMFPFTVKINLADIGGPSAGHDVRARDHRQAHAGQPHRRQVHRRDRRDRARPATIEPIGGIQQKMAGARAAGATIFLTPAANCSNTTGAVPAGLRLVKVSSLAQAVSDLQAIKKGKPVPS